MQVKKSVCRKTKTPEKLFVAGAAYIYKKMFACEFSDTLVKKITVRPLALHKGWNTCRKASTISPGLSREPGTRKYTLQDSGNTNKNKMAAKRVFDLNEASVLKLFFALFSIYHAHDRMRGLDYHVFYCSHRLLT